MTALVRLQGMQSKRIDIERWLVDVAQAVEMTSDLVA